MTRGMKPLFLISVLFLLLLSSSHAARQRIDYVSLEIAVQQREDGKLGKGYHLLKLQCTRGDCQMITLSLNQCLAAAFYPKIEMTSTREGSLRVTDLGGILDVQETVHDIGGQSTISLRIGYAASPAGTLANRITSFSGGFVKSSALLERVVNVEYVPLPRPYQNITLACAVSLPGLGSQ